MTIIDLVGLFLMAYVGGFFVFVAALLYCVFYVTHENPYLIIAFAGLAALSWAATVILVWVR